MKKVKLLTSLAAFVLVLGLGACDVTEEETPDEGDKTTETSDTTETGDTGEGGESGDTDTDLEGYALVGTFEDSSWDSKPSVDSKYYIPLGETEYNVTVTMSEAVEGTDNAKFRIVEWGDSWDLVAGYDDLAEGSTGVIGEGDDKNIAVNWGATYDIAITFGDTNSILVTLQTTEGDDDGDETPTLLGVEVDGIINYIDGGLVGSYSYEGSLTTNIDEAIPVTCTEAEGENAYYLTFERNNTTYYVCITTVGEYLDLQYETTPTAIYYDATLDGWVNEDGTYFLCYNATYNCFYASAIAEYGPNGSKNNPSPIAHLYDYPTIQGITLSAESTEVAETQSLRIDVTYTPATIGASNLTWESSNTDVATVEDGRVTGVEASDEAVTITATTKNGLTATIDITVIEYVVPDGLVGTITFSSSDTKASTTAFTTSTLQTCLTAAYSGTGTITAGETAYTYPGSNGSGTGLKGSADCVQLAPASNGKGDGSFTFSLSDTDSIVKVVVKVVYYDSVKNMTINENATSITYNCTDYSSWDDVPETVYELTATTSFTFSAAKGNRMLIHSIELYSA